MRTKLGLIVLLGSLSFGISCSKSGSSGGSSGGGVSTDVADAVNLVAKGVGAIGTGMSGASSMGELGPMTVTQFNSNRCNAHGRPLASDLTSDLAESDEFYPYLHTYCAVSVNDGDTVRGGFSLVRSLICALEKGGIQFDNEEQTITGDFSDTTCWPDGAPGDESGTFTMVATGSSPASFNSHFEKGVVFSVPAFGLEFEIAANLGDDKIEFVTRENWTGSGESQGDTGTMAGELTKSTGVLRFEQRTERVRSTCSASRCGWNRHSRLYAVLSMSASGEPDGLTSLSYGYSDIQANAATVGGSSAGYGKLITASGTLSDSVKARIFTTTANRSLTELATTGQYTEDTNSACASSSGFDDSVDCSSNSGIGAFSSTAKFSLLSSTGRTSVENWAHTFAGFNFTTVNLDTDNAF